MLREALKRMGRSDLIGNSERHLVPREDGRADRAATGTGARRTAPNQSQIARKFGLTKPAPGRSAGGASTRSPARKVAKGVTRTGRK